MLWVSLHSKEYIYFCQYPDTSKMVWKTRHFGARKLIFFILSSMHVWHDLLFFHAALTSVALSQCQWCLECQTRHIVNLLQILASKCWNHIVYFNVFEGNSETIVCTWLKVSLKTSGLLESLNLHYLVSVCWSTVLSQSKYMSLVPNRSQEWTLNFWQ